jgi:hypothetical protein
MDDAADAVQQDDSEQEPGFFSNLVTAGSTALSNAGTAAQASATQGVYDTITNFFGGKKTTGTTTTSAISSKMYIIMAAAVGLALVYFFAPHLLGLKRR